jgi:hypothetical protein
MSTSPVLCACGRPLHYESDELNEMMEALISVVGETVKVTTPRGTWIVPRHYIALHGIKAVELEQLANHYGWEKVDRV